jgi:hypothetical protein
MSLGTLRPEQVSVLAMRDTGVAPEAEVTRDLVRRGLVVAPVLVALAFAVRGADGAWSAGYALGVVLANFVVAASLITLTARVSYAVMMAAVLFGYLGRLALVCAAVFAVRTAAWADLPTLGITLIVTHLGLLFWESRAVSMSLAFPGLRPGRPDRGAAA